MNVTLLTTRDAVEALVPAWRDLLADSGGNQPTLSPSWLLAWWDVYGALQGRRLRFLRFDAGDRLVGLAPLLARRHWYRPGIPFRRLELLASGEREADSVCSDYLDVITRRGHEADVARAFAAAVRNDVAGGWDEIVLSRMAGDGVMPALLAQGCREAGFEAEVTQITEAPFIPLPASWEAYLAALDRKDRYLIKRTLRDFEQWAGSDAVFHRASNAAELDQGKRILRELHLQRWQGTADGTFRSPLFLAFHDRVMRDFLHAGALELLWLTVRGEPIAATYNFRWDRKLLFYQGGRKMDVPKNVRAGGVIVYHAIRSAIEAGLREFDFLGGDEFYKSQLALASRPLVRLRVNRRCLVECLRKGVAWTEDRLRPIVRRLRSSARGPALRPAPEQKIADSADTGVASPAQTEKVEKSLTTGQASDVG